MAAPTSTRAAMMSSNVDHAEIAKFEALAERWWDSEGEFKPLHAINPLRLSWIDEHAPLSGRRVLDVGCGGGILAESMARSGAEVTGIDMGEAPLTVARRHAQASGVQHLDYQRIAVEELAAQTPAAYDIVTCMEMLEHVPQPDSVVAACKNLVKPGGWVFFSSINRNPKSWLFAIVGAEYVLRLLPRGTHDYERFIRPSELDAWMRQHGLQREDMTGLHYHPLTRRFWLADNVDVNYMVASRRSQDA